MRVECGSVVDHMAVGSSAGTRRSAAGASRSRIGVNDRLTVTHSPVTASRPPPMAIAIDVDAAKPRHSAAMPA